MAIRLYKILNYYCTKVIVKRFSPALVGCNTVATMSTCPNLSFANDTPSFALIFTRGIFTTFPFLSISCRDPSMSGYVSGASQTSFTTAACTEVTATANPEPVPPISAARALKASASRILPIIPTLLPRRPSLLPSGSSPPASHSLGTHWGQFPLISTSTGPTGRLAKPEPSSVSLSTTPSSVVK